MSALDDFRELSRRKNEKEISEEEFRREVAKLGEFKIDCGDKINPSHYTFGNIECIDAIESALGKEQFIGFLRGQIIKYTWRLGRKDCPKIDNDKAIWYANKLAEILGKD